jgi:hypothetical protein
MCTAVEPRDGPSRVSRTACTPPGYAGVAAPVSQAGHDPLVGSWPAAQADITRQLQIFEFWRRAMRNKTPEPSLDDLFDDPILHALLASDGLKLEEVRRFLDEMKRRLQLTHRKAA